MSSPQEAIKRPTWTVFKEAALSPPAYEGSQSLDEDVPRCRVCDSQAARKSGGRFSYDLLCSKHRRVRTLGRAVGFLLTPVLVVVALVKLYWEVNDRA